MRHTTSRKEPHLANVRHHAVRECGTAAAYTRYDNTLRIHDHRQMIRGTPSAHHQHTLDFDFPEQSEAKACRDPTYVVEQKRRPNIASPLRHTNSVACSCTTNPSLSFPLSPASQQAPHPRNSRRSLAFVYPAASCFYCFCCCCVPVSGTPAVRSSPSSLELRLILLLGLHGQLVCDDVLHPEYTVHKLGKRSGESLCKTVVYLLGLSYGRSRNRHIVLQSAHASYELTCIQGYRR